MHFHWAAVKRELHQGSSLLLLTSEAPDKYSVREKRSI